MFAEQANEGEKEKEEEQESKLYYQLFLCQIPLKMDAVPRLLHLKNIQSK